MGCFVFVSSYLCKVCLIVLEQEDVVAMGSAASLCIHTLFCHYLWAA